MLGTLLLTALIALTIAFARRCFSGRSAGNFDNPTREATATFATLLFDGKVEQISFSFCSSVVSAHLSNGKLLGTFAPALTFVHFVDCNKGALALRPIEVTTIPVAPILSQSQIDSFTRCGRCAGLLFQRDAQMCGDGSRSIFDTPLKDQANSLFQSVLVMFDSEKCRSIFVGELMQTGGVGQSLNNRESWINYLRSCHGAQLTLAEVLINRCCRSSSEFLEQLAKSALEQSIMLELMGCEVLEVPLKSISLVDNGCDSFPTIDELRLIHPVWNSDDSTMLDGDLGLSCNVTWQAGFRCSYVTAVAGFRVSFDVTASNFKGAAILTVDKPPLNSLWIRFITEPTFDVAVAVNGAFRTVSGIKWLPQNVQRAVAQMFRSTLSGRVTTDMRINSSVDARPRCIPGLQSPTESDALLQRFGFMLELTSLWINTYDELMRNWYEHSVQMVVERCQWTLQLKCQEERLRHRAVLLDERERDIEVMLNSLRSTSLERSVSSGNVLVGEPPEVALKGSDANGEGHRSPELVVHRCKPDADRSMGIFVNGVKIPAVPLHLVTRDTSASASENGCLPFSASTGSDYCFPSISNSARGGPPALPEGRSPDQRVELAISADVMASVNSALEKDESNSGSCKARLALAQEIEAALRVDLCVSCRIARSEVIVENCIISSAQVTVTIRWAQQQSHRALELIAAARNLANLKEVCEALRVFQIKARCIVLGGTPPKSRRTVPVECKSVVSSTPLQQTRSRCAAAVDDLGLTSQRALLEKERIAARRALSAIQVETPPSGSCRRELSDTDEHPSREQDSLLRHQICLVECEESATRADIEIMCIHDHQVLLMRWQPTNTRIQLPSSQNSSFEAARSAAASFNFVSFFQIICDDETQLRIRLADLEANQRASILTSKKQRGCRITTRLVMQVAHQEQSQRSVIVSHEISERVALLNVISKDLRDSVPLPTRVATLAGRADLGRISPLAVNEIIVEEEVDFSPVARGDETFSSPTLEAQRLDASDVSFDWEDRAEFGLCRREAKPFHYVTFEVADMEHAPSACNVLQCVLRCFVSRHMTVSSSDAGSVFHDGDIILDIDNVSLHSHEHLREVIGSRVLRIKQCLLDREPDLAVWKAGHYCQLEVDKVTSKHPMEVLVIRGSELQTLIVYS